MDFYVDVMPCVPPFACMPGPQAGYKHARRNALIAARTARIRAHIDSHLADPDLSAHAAARALGMSVRSLHLALAPAGQSFGELLQARRLAACYEKMRRPGNIATIADIAFDCGFNSLSSFYRAFRRVHDACPRAISRNGLQLEA